MRAGLPAAERGQEIDESPSNATNVPSFGTSGRWVLVGPHVFSESPTKVAVRPLAPESEAGD